MSDDHERFMSECLLLAELGKGQVSPNPLVGAVLVRDGRVVARGYHQRCGGPHAEMNCLAHYTGDVRSATMYVSLEPCSHHGKTPPCADMLSGSGLRHVVVGMKDPNPLVSGRGIERLRNAGVEVTVGVLEREARELNRVFVTHIRAKRPYVHVKIAQSMDGFIASPNARRRWISSAASRALVHRWRAEYDAVLVGAGTVRKDNPRLNVRLVEGRDPAIVIVDGKFSTPLHARVFKGDQQVIVLVDRNRTRSSVRKLERAKARGITVVASGGEKGKVPLRKI
ncbi:MAG: bifunctional diaminohydroxyphosphoribosylaminopyrimidine deaminase/5-amino-6-(5-phosphoribosylamino)uracil reductase RibD, partial [Bacteroidetes bacterium]|nr:bifunctional diaminohydroxyphosphoribosylaminopyrimidine deaminase/5-amino-6-(5-phosphoribosylamino)uracil reductase RibD [Bacteroidota bacterium]